MKNIITIIFALVLIAINRISGGLSHAVGTIQNTMSFTFSIVVATVINVFAAVITIVRWKGFMNLSPVETAKMYVAGIWSSWRFMFGLFKEYQKHNHVSWLKRSEAVRESLSKDDGFTDIILSAM